MPDPHSPNPAEATPAIPIHIPLYFNGFALGVSNADISFQLKIDNRQIVELKASYTVMKTLSKALSGVVEQFEKMTGRDLMTTEFIDKAIKAATNQEPKAK